MNIESSLRQADYAYKETHVTEDGELDLFIAGEGMPSIAVKMAPDGSGGLTMSGAEFISEEWLPVVIHNDDGDLLDAEAGETLAHELIEHELVRGLEYAYGREASTDNEGNPARIGATIDRSVFNEDVMAMLGPETGFSFT